MLIAASVLNLLAASAVVYAIWWGAGVFRSEIARIQPMVSASHDAAERSAVAAVEAKGYTLRVAGQHQRVLDLEVRLEALRHEQRPDCRDELARLRDAVERLERRGAT